MLKLIYDDVSEKVQYSMIVLGLMVLVRLFLEFPRMVNPKKKVFPNKIGENMICFASNVLIKMSVFC